MFIEKCSECGEDFSMEFRSFNDYVYKTKGRNKYGKVTIFYQCSYTCYRKAWEKHKNDFKRKSNGQY